MRGYMKREDLVNVIVEAAKVTQDTAREVLNKLLETITYTLKKGEEVTLMGFGTFRVRKRKARPGRNPQTGEVLQIAASNIATFKAGKTLKDAMQDTIQK
jgi:nucleoid DNA-binding protein